MPDLAAWLGGSGTVVTSPARRCHVPGAPTDPRLAPWDLGAWAGRPLADVDLAAWRSDPAYDAHGGESLLALQARVRGVLAQWQPLNGRLAAVTHAAVIKLAVTCALRAPVDAAWDIDIGPAEVAELHGGPGGWRLVRLGGPP